MSTPIAAAVAAAFGLVATSPVHAGDTQPGVTARHDSITAQADSSQTDLEPHHLILTPQQAPQPHPTSYRVRPGDTLSGIAGQFCGSPGRYRNLASANNLADADFITPGETLRLACHAALKAIASPAQAPQQPQVAPAVTITSVSGNVPQEIAAAMLGQFGWGSDQMGCLDALWNTESGWNTYASNPSSGAYGIPQALPGGKMASAGSDWQTNPVTQIRWGLGYIQASYGSPCSAEAHEQADGWY